MANDRVIRVMIVDDHAVVRSGIRLSLLAFDDLELVAEAENCEEALAVCDRLRDTEALPDVILMDMLMPGADGVTTTYAILDRHPEVRVIALASFDTEMLMQDALRAGAAGFLPKATPIDELAEAIRAADAGRAAPAPAAMRALPKPSRELTDREREVLPLVVEGLSNLEISRRLGISPSAAESHVSAILCKLGAANRAEAAALAAKHGLIS